MTFHMSHCQIKGMPYLTGQFFQRTIKEKIRCLIFGRDSLVKFKLFSKKVRWRLKTECYGGGTDVSSEGQEDLYSNPILLKDYKKLFGLPLSCIYFSFSSRFILNV